MEPEVYREMAEVQETHWWFVARRRILASVISGLDLSSEGEILEIGCGAGGNLAMLASFGRLRAVELDETARTIATDLGICDVAAGGLPEPIPFDDGAFDLVCLLDVLEHIKDDCAALVRAGRLLRPTGRLLVTVPAYPWLWSAHDDAHHHQRRYTKEMLCQKAQGAGLIISRLGYFNTLLFPLIAGIRIIARITGTERGSDAALPSPLTNRILAGIFSSERHFLSHRLFCFGTSILAVLSLEPLKTS
ncbi:MAG: class I SAM-dependent methyltransferase [Syntrophaceae bacterium]|nr:class I SAM-dependent methyltransferase [Syntrophaceae bacterium]